MPSLFSILILIQGLGFDIAGAVLYRRTRTRIADSYRAWGEVVEVKVRPGHETLVKHPVIRYHTATGEETTFESALGKSHWKIKPGDRIEILVRKSQPKDAEVVSWFAQCAGVTICGMTSVMSLVVWPIMDRFFWR